MYARQVTAGRPGVPKRAVCRSTTSASRFRLNAAIARDNADVLETLQRLEAEGRPAFDPYRVQWRSDRLEWVIKNGFADWFAEEMRAGRTFFPITVAP